MDQRSRTRASYGGTGPSRFSRKRRSRALLAEPSCRPLVSRRRIEEIRKQIEDDGEPADDHPPAKEDTEQIPPKILELAAIAPDSALYKALSKQSLFDWPLSIYPSVLSDLNQLLSACVTLKYLPESGYIDHVALDIRTERSERLVIRTLSLREVETLLFEKAEQLDRREQTWAEREANLKRRRDSEAQAVEQEMQARLAIVDNEWDSEATKELYRRPSPELAALRQRAEEDPSLADEVAQKEEEERQSADAKREEGHITAQELVRQQHQADLEQIEKEYEKDWKEMQNVKVLEFRRIERSIENLQAQKDRLQIGDPLNFYPMPRSRSPARTSSKATTLPRLGP